MAAIRSVAQCDVASTLVQDVTQLGTGLALFAKEVAYTLEALDPSRPFSGAFAAPLLAVAVSVLDRVECACALDRGVLYAPARAVLTHPAMPDTVGAHVTLLLSLVSVPLQAAERMGWTISAGKWADVTRVNTAPVFDSAANLLENGAQVVDAGLAALLEAFQEVVVPHGPWFEWPPVARVAAQYLSFLVEVVRIAVNALASVVHMATDEIRLSSDPNKAPQLFDIYGDVFDGTVAHTYLDAALNGTVEDVLGASYGRWLPALRVAGNLTRGAVGAAWCGYDMVVAVVSRWIRGDIHCN